VLAEAGRATRSDGVVWLYFAGHASVLPTNGERVLLPLEASETTESLLSAGLLVDDAVKLASARGAQVMVIGDTSYNRVGAGSPAVEVDWLPPTASVTELTATRSGVVATPLDSVKHGAFAYVLLGALRGWADGVGGPKDGVVTAAEAMAYTTSALDAMGFDAQDPYLDYAGEMADPFALVSRGRGVFEAAPVLPPMAGDAAPVVVSGGGPQTQIVVVGAAAAPLSDFDLQRVEAECVAEARRLAEASMILKVSFDAEMRQTSMIIAWDKLKVQAEKALTRPAEERAPMIAAVEKFLADAKGFTGTREADEVTVFVALRPSSVVGKDVECGTRTVPVAVRTTVVPVAAVQEAEAMLERLKPPPPAPSMPATERSCGPSGYKLVWVPAGSFDMGSPASEEGRFSDEQRHRVTLTTGYWAGTTEVTQGLWSKVTGSNPSKFKACGPDCPVEQVSWCDTVAFANALSRLDGLRPVYAGVDACASNPGAVTWDRSADGYRLPTEAEWELAARGGEEGMFSGSELDAMAWYAFNSGGTTHPVCTKHRNGLGLCDVIGNVWEWTWDGYGAYQAGMVTDPTGPDVASARVFRGGSWYDGAESQRVAIRNRLGPELRDVVLGVRLVRSEVR